MSDRVKLIDSFLKVQRKYLAHDCPLIFCSVDSFEDLAESLGVGDGRVRVTYDEWKSTEHDLAFKIDMELYKGGLDTASFVVPMAEYTLSDRFNESEVVEGFERVLRGWVRARNVLLKELKVGSELILDGCIHPFRVDFVCDLGVYGRHEGLEGGEYLEDYYWWESFGSIMGVLSEKELVE